MIRLVVSSIIGMTCGFVTHSIMNGSNITAYPLLPVITSFCAFIVIWVASYFALKYLDNIDREKR